MKTVSPFFKVKIFSITVPNLFIITSKLIPFVVQIDHIETNENIVILLNLIKYSTIVLYFNLQYKIKYKNQLYYKVHLWLYVKKFKTYTGKCIYIR